LLLANAPARIQMMSWIDEQGNLIRLGPRLTTPGGEGVIHQLADNVSAVAKIYHRPPSPQKLAKLHHLRRHSTKRLLDIAAWPTALLLDGNARQNVRGFIMPFVKGKEIHRLYGPHDRYTEFPTVSWDFLVHVAKNSAAAFETLHGHDVVMADVNEKNLLVTSEGFVRVIDCDSYQISHSSGVFTCDVGVPLWTAPELQGRDFRGLVRTKNHDQFGLAVLIFQLLFMGRHPFAGVPDRPEQFEIERAIAQFLFAFTGKTRALDIRPPPHTLPLNSLPTNLMTLFERAFLRGSEADSARPTAGEWHHGLDFLSKNLRGCSRDPGHKYPSHLSKCPWCEIYDGGGPNFFISVAVHVAPQYTAANVGIYWAAIQQVTLRPLKPKEAPAFTAIRAIGTALPKGISRTRPEFYWGWIIMGASIPAFWLLGCWAAIGILVGWALVAEGPASSAFRAEVDRRRQHLQRVRSEVQSLLDDAKRIPAEYQKQFAKKKTDLQAAYTRYLHLDQERRGELQKLELKKRDLQMNEFLDKILIRDNDIPEIGHKRKQALQAYGIESALDISYAMNVPGFGPHLTAVLVSWRRRCEGRFRYNPAGPLPQKEAHQLDLRIADLRRSLEIELRSGPQSLNELGVLAERKLRDCEAKSVNVVQRLAQAEADMAVAS
jgi:DNA-binding helix-hairpin-helix protein with protein kinase domain